MCVPWLEERHAVRSSAASAGLGSSACRRNKLKTTGTKNNVATVANTRAANDRAAQRRVLLAAFAEAQAHGQHADDHGQRRHQHRADAADAGFQAACSGSSPRCKLFRAKVTTSTELAVATPMLMIAPINAGTLKVVMRQKQRPDHAGQRAGQRGDDDERIEPALEVDHQQQINQHNRAITSPMPSPMKLECIVSAWPRTMMKLPRGSSFSACLTSG